MSDSDESVEEVTQVEAEAELGSNPLIPEKSKERYELAYSHFEEWLSSQDDSTLSQKVVLAYFVEQAQKWKPSTLWCRYSMLRTILSVRKKMDISKYHQLIAFLKKKSRGYLTKKSEIFTKNDIHRFLKDFSDSAYLLMKVVMIIGIFGACRRDELTNLMIQNVRDHGECVKITLPVEKRKQRRKFTITPGNLQGIDCLALFRKYYSLRPRDILHGRFFVNYRNGKCTRQPVGINKIGGIPSQIATLLELKEPVKYTGHCFRRSSASLLVDAGTVMHSLNLGWKSDSDAEGDGKASVDNDKVIASKIKLEPPDITYISSDDEVVDTTIVKVEPTDITASSNNVAGEKDIVKLEPETVVKLEPGIDN